MILIQPALSAISRPAFWQNNRQSLVPDVENRSISVQNSNETIAVSIIVSPREYLQYNQ